MRKTNIVGLYNLDKVSKTTLKLNSDSTFEFSKNNRNPYLLPYHHEDEFFWDTKGKWNKVNKNTIALTSQSDTLIYPLFSLTSHPAKNPKLSNFTFHDVDGDTVKILYVQYSDSTIAALSHDAMASFTEDITKRDTLEFHFYGYHPYAFISEQKLNQDYDITLKHVFLPDFFKKTEFKIKNKQLIEIRRNAKFRLKKSGI